MRVSSKELFSTLKNLASITLVLELKNSHDWVQTYQKQSVDDQLIAKLQSGVESVAFVFIDQLYIGCMLQYNCYSTFAAELNRRHQRCAFLLVLGVDVCTLRTEKNI